MSQTLAEFAAASPDKDPKDLIREYRNQTQLDLLRSGEYDEDLVAEIDGQLLEHAAQQGIEMQDFSPPEGNDADLVARHAMETGEPEVESAARKFQALLSPQVRASYGDPAEYEDAREQARTNYEAAAPTEKREAAKRAALNRGDLPFATFQDKDGNRRVELGAEALKLASDDADAALAEMFAANPNLDRSLIPEIRRKLKTPEGFTAPLATIERQQDFTAAFQEVAPYQVKGLADAIAKGSTDNLDPYLDQANAALEGTPLAEQFSDEERKAFIRDYATRVAPIELDPEAPEKNLRTLSTGEVHVPVPVQMNKAVFEKALPSIPEGQREMAKAQREQVVAAYAKDAFRTITQRRPEFADHFAEQKAAGKTDTEILDEWTADPANQSTAYEYASGIAESIPAAVLTAAAALPALGGNKTAAGVIKYFDTQTRQRQEFANIIGKDLGVGYDIGTMIAPVVVDIFATRGAASLARGTVGAAARAAVKPVVRGFFGATVQAETKGLVNQFVKGSVARETARQGGLAPTTVWQAIGRDIEAGLTRAEFSAGMFASGFNRAAGQSYVGMYSTLEGLKNPDGSRKYNDEQVRDMAVKHATTVGTMTGLTTLGFNALGAAGLERIFSGGLTRKQLTAVHARLQKDWKNMAPSVKEGIDMTDADAMLASMMAKSMTPLWKVGVQGAVEEFPEEATQQFLEEIQNSYTTGEPFDVVKTLKGALYAGMLGGVMGGGATVAADVISSPEVDARREAAVRRNALLETARKLDESNSPQTAAAVRQLAAEGIPQAPPAEESVPSGVPAAGDESAPSGQGVAEPQTVTTNDTDRISKGTQPREVAEATGDEPPLLGEPEADDRPADPTPEQVAAYRDARRQEIVAEWGSRNTRSGVRPGTPAEVRQELEQINQNEQNQEAEAEEASVPVPALPEGTEAQPDLEPTGGDAEVAALAEAGSEAAVTAETSPVTPAAAPQGVNSQPQVGDDVEITVGGATMEGFILKMDEFTAEVFTTKRTRPYKVRIKDVKVIQPNNRQNDETNEGRSVLPGVSPNAGSANRTRGPLSRGNQSVLGGQGGQPGTSLRNTGNREASPTGGSPSRVGDPITFTSSIPGTQTPTQGVIDSIDAKGKITARVERGGKITKYPNAKIAAEPTQTEITNIEAVLAAADIDPTPAERIVTDALTDSDVPEAALAETPGGREALAEVVNDAAPEIVTDGMPLGTMVGLGVVSENVKTLVAAEQSTYGNETTNSGRVSNTPGRAAPVAGLAGNTAGSVRPAAGSVQGNPADTRAEGTPASESRGGTATPTTDARTTRGESPLVEVSNSTNPTVRKVGRPPEQLTPDEAAEAEFQTRWSGKKVPTFKEWKEKNPKPNRLAREEGTSRSEQAEKFARWVERRKNTLWNSAAKGRAIPKDWVEDVPTKDFMLASGYAKQGDVWVALPNSKPAKPEDWTDYDYRVALEGVEASRQEQQEASKLFNTHSVAVQQAVEAGRPVSAEAMDLYYGGSYPGYVRQGYLYINQTTPQPNANTTTEAAAPLVAVTDPTQQSLDAVRQQLPASAPDTRFTPTSSPVTKELAQFGGVEDIKVFLVKVAKNGKPEHRELAKILLRFPDVLVTPVHLQDAPFAGTYVPQTGQILINTARPGPRGGVDTVLHELIHAATHAAIKNPTPEQALVLKRIDGIRRNVAKRAAKAGRQDLAYGLGSNDEFFTHLLTSPAFQREVAAMTPKGERNWVQVLIDAVRDLLGLGKVPQGVLKDMLEFTQSAADTNYGTARMDALMQMPEDVRDEVRFAELTESLGATPTQADIDSFKAENAAAYAELKAMRERVLRGAGYEGPWFHGTDKPFTQFSKSYTAGQMGFHVGTKSQAGFFSETPMELFLRAENPLRLEDSGSWYGQEAARIVGEALGKKMLRDSDSALAREIQNAGYDSVVYANTKEWDDTVELEPQDSYIAFSPSQLKSTEPLSLDPATGQLIPPSEWGNAESPSILFQPSEDAPVEERAKLASSDFYDGLVEIPDGLSVDVSGRGGVLTLESLFLDPEQRGNGFGSRVLKLLTRVADKHQVPAELEVGEDEAGIDLVDFYSRYGFEMQDGFMRREPRPYDGPDTPLFQPSERLTASHDAGIAALDNPTDAERASFREHHDLATTGNVSMRQRAQYRTDATALERLVTYLRAAVRELATSLKASFNMTSAVHLDRLGRELAAAEDGYKVRSGVKAFDPNDAPLFQFAGENAVQPQFMQDSLVTAKAMAAAGKASEEIRAITGWFPGKYDGKMRWEIPDEKASLKESFGEATKVSELIDHPALFGAYPSISEFPVAFQGFGAGISKDGKTLVLPSMFKSFKSSNSAVFEGILHEVQHIIQSIEGFARGGNTQDIYAEETQQIQAKLGRLEEAREEAKIKYEADRSEENLQAWSRSIDAIWKVMGEKPAKRSGEEELAYYRRIAGEIEARDVQARVNMTPEQLAATAPYSSENIAPEASIVLFQLSSNADPAEFKWTNFTEVNEGNKLYKSTDADEVKKGWWARMFTRRDDLRRPLSALRVDRMANVKVIRQKIETAERLYNQAIKAENPDMDTVRRYVGSTAPLLTPEEENRLDAEYQSRLEATTGMAQPRIEQARKDRDKALRNAKTDEEKAAAWATYEMEEASARNVEAEALRGVDEWLTKAKNTSMLNRARELRTQRDLAGEELSRTSPQMFDALRRFREATDELQAKLARDYKDSHPELSWTIDRSNGIYLVRAYKFHNDPMRAEKLLTDPAYDDLRDRLIDFFGKHLADDEFTNLKNDPAFAGEPDSVLMAQARKNVEPFARLKFEDYVKGHEGAHSMGNFAEGVRVEIERFMKKKNLAPEITELLGEIDDPLFNAKNTMIAVSNILFTHRMNKAIMEDGVRTGTLITKEQKESNIKYRHWQALKSVSENSQAYYPLGGLYASPEDKKAFDAAFNSSRNLSNDTAGEAMETLNKFILGASGKSMGIMILGNPGTYVRNVVGNSLIAMSQGANPFSAKGHKSAMAAWNMMRGQGKGDEEFIEKMIAYRILGDGVNISYMREFMKQYRENPLGALDWAAAKGENISPEAMEALRKAGSGWGKMVDVLSRTSEFTETYIGPLIFLNELDALTKAGMPQLEAEQEAARITKLVTPGNTEVPQAVTGFSKHPISALIAPFLRFKSEMFRTVVNTWVIGWEHFNSDNPALKAHGARRLASASIIQGGVTILLPIILQLLSGISDEEDQLIRASMPNYAKNSSFWYFRNDDGSLQTWDLTFTIPYSINYDAFTQSIKAAMKGRWEDVPGNFVRLITDEIIGEQIVAGTLLDVARNKDETSGNEIWLDVDSFGERSYKAAMHVIEGSYIPAAIKKSMQAAQALDRPAKEDEPFFFTPVGTMIGMAAPFKPRDHALDKLATRAFRSVTEANRQLWLITSKLGSPQGMAEGEAAKLYQERTDAHVKNWTKAYKYAAAAKSLGLSTREVMKAMKDADMSQERSQLALRGLTNIKPLPSETMKRAKEIDPNRYAELVRATRQQPSIIDLRD